MLLAFVKCKILNCPIGVKILKWDALLLNGHYAGARVKSLVDYKEKSERKIMIKIMIKIK